MPDPSPTTPEDPAPPFPNAPGRRWLAVLALVVTTALWGTSFLVMQATLTHDLWLMLAVRMFIGAATILVLARGHCVALPRLQRGPWVWLGLLVATAFGTQGLGVTGTSVANSALLTGFCVAFTPALMLLLKQARPTRGQWAGAAIGVCAFTVLGASQGFSRLNLYDGVTLVAALAVALHTIYFGAAVAAPGLLLNVVFYQFVVAGCVLFLGHVCFEPWRVRLTPGELAGLAYLGVTGCGIASALQGYGQRTLSPVPAVLIISTEPLWAILITRVVRGDLLRGGALAAGGLLLLANLIAEARAPRHGSVRA